MATNTLLFECDSAMAVIKTKAAASKTSKRLQNKWIAQHTLRRMQSRPWDTFI